MFKDSFHQQIKKFKASGQSGAGSTGEKEAFSLRTHRRGYADKIASTLASDGQKNINIATTLKLTHTLELKIEELLKGID